MNVFWGFSDEQSQENHRNDAPDQGAAFGESWPETELARTFTRVQINALFSGEMRGSGLSLELFDRIHRLSAASGHRLHSLEVELVRMPVTCPGCGQRALCRCHRKGLLQTRLYPLFGWYPWNCTCCRREWLLRLRHPPVYNAISPDQPGATSRKAA